MADVLTRDFVSSDLGVSARNLRKDRDPEKRTDILDNIDRKAVTERMMKLLEIRNREQQTVQILPEHTAQIKQYLKALDLIVECPIQNAETGIGVEEHVIFTQPGMRYCQARALVWSLMQDETFGQLSLQERNSVTERILEEVRGRMLEDIVLLESTKALGKNYEVFKYRFAAGEFDMVICEKQDDICAVYEIKHSKRYVPEQAS